MEILRKKFQRIKKAIYNKKSDKIMKTNLCLLKKIGIWSDSNKRSYEIIMFLVTVCVVSSLVYPELIYLFYTSDGISEMTQTIGILLGLISTEIKHFILFFKRGKFRSLFNELQKQYLKTLGKRNSTIIINADKECQILVLRYSIFLCCLSIVGVWKSLLLFIYQKIAGLPQTPLSTPFKFEQVYGFSSGQSIRLFWYFYLAFRATWAALNVGAIDCAFVCFSIHLRGHIIILRKRIEDIGKHGRIKTYVKNRHRFIMKNDDKEISRKLKYIISQHNTIIDYVNSMEDIFSYQFLIDFNLCSLKICFMLFQISVNIYDTDQLLIFVGFGFGSVLQLLMFSKYGQQIITQSLQIADAAYGCSWYNYSKEIQRNLILVIQRAQRPLGITAGKFYYISKGTVAGILSGAFSYFTLLRAVREK